jgi:hypothetical protein
VLGATTGHGGPLHRLGHLKLPRCLNRFTIGLTRASLFVLAQLLDGNPVLPLWRNIKFPSRYLFGFLCIGSLNRSEMFGALADDIDAPAGHHIIASVTIAIAKTIAKSASQRMARRNRLIATSCRHGTVSCLNDIDHLREAYPSGPLLASFFLISGLSYKSTFNRELRISSFPLYSI